MNAFANLPFATSRPLTLGVELELQLVSPRDYDLTRAATDLLAALKARVPAYQVPAHIALRHEALPRNTNGKIVMIESIVTHT